MMGWHREKLFACGKWSGFYGNNPHKNFDTARAAAPLDRCQEHCKGGDLCGRNITSGAELSPPPVNFGTTAQGFQQNWKMICKVVAKDFPVTCGNVLPSSLMAVFVELNLGWALNRVLNQILEIIA